MARRTTEKQALIAVDRAARHAPTAKDAEPTPIVKAAFACLVNAQYRHAPMVYRMAKRAVWIAVVFAIRVFKESAMKRREKSSEFDTPESFGERVRALRKERLMTIAEVAERSGLTAVYLSDIENGKRDPCYSAIERVANGLDMSVAELFGVVPRYGLEAMSFARRCAKADQSVRQWVLNQLRAFPKLFGG